MALINVATATTGARTIDIDSASGNDRLLIALLTENNWDSANLATTATINSVNGTSVDISGGAPDGSKAEAWYWLDANLPATAGNYNVTVNGNNGNGRQLSVFYFENAIQQAPVDPIALLLDARGDFTDTLVADQPACAIIGTMWNVGGGGNSVSLGADQISVANLTENNGIHTHSYSEDSLTFLHDYTAFEANVSLAFAVEYNAGTSSTPDESLGGSISITEITNSTLQNLFDNIAAVESQSGDTEYRCVYVKNTNATLTMQNSKIWVFSNTPNTESTIAIGLGSSAINGTEQTIANESTPPIDVTFSAAANEGAALSLGNIPPGQHKAVWIRRTVSSNSSAYANDNFVLRVKCESAE